MRQTPCPSCRYARAWKLRRGKLKCKNCRKEFSGQRYPVKGFRIPEETWGKAISSFLRERTLLRVAEAAAASPKTAQRMTHHLRSRMLKEVPAPFRGPVEMDETYIGGQRKNKRLHIRRIQGKKGHGTDKLPIVGLFCRHSREVIVSVEPHRLDIAFISLLVQDRVLPGSLIITDGFKMYRGLPAFGFRHEFVDHLQGETVRGRIHANNIEGFWGILKRKLGCIGGVRRERLPYFVAEIVWRFNHRDQPLEEQERELKKLVFDT